MAYKVFFSLIFHLFGKNWGLLNGHEEKSTIEKEKWPEHATTKMDKYIAHEETKPNRDRFSTLSRQVQCTSSDVRRRTSLILKK